MPRYDVETDPHYLLPEAPPDRDFYVVEEDEEGYGTEAAVGLVGLALAGVGGYLAFRYYLGGQRDSRSGGSAYRGQGVDPAALYDRGLHLHEAVTINQPRSKVYDYFRDFQNHPHFMENVESVRVEGTGGVGTKSHWTAKGPAGTSFEYDAETIVDEKDKTISWRTVSDTAVQHAGTAKFRDAPGGRGTEVHLEVQYLPPGGQMLGGFGRSLLGLVGQDPDRMVRRGLRNLQRLLETGELPTIAGQSRGNCK